ncbi:UNVERIFIED_CONTAM: hypothetical protein Sradi_4094900 [Sesamum radiatum]|uniref:Twin-arginine translocation signal domain-containing protein n=1 Tax=Sesamum radiatum TaxID=300843 RepID=A0AAW2PJX3_SESRA
MGDSGDFRRRIRARRLEGDETRGSSVTVGGKQFARWCAWPDTRRKIFRRRGGGAAAVLVAGGAPVRR